jgi:hypothetical protein
MSFYFCLIFFCCCLFRLIFIPFLSQSLASFSFSGCVLPFNNIASALLLERDYFKEISGDCQLTNNNECQSSTNVPIHCAASKWYQPPLPLDVTLSDGNTYAPLTSDDIDCTDDFWSDGCAEEFCNRQTDAQTQAGIIMSIPYIISACLSPFLGGFVDKFGMRAVIATIAPAMLVIVHAFLGFTSTSPIGPLVGQGLAYAGFAAVIWPSVPLIVPQRLVGLAYGVAFSIQNAGLASFPLIVAAIYTDNGDHYIPDVEVFFVIVALCGVLVGFYLNFYDHYFIEDTLNKVHQTPVDGLADGEGSQDGANPIHKDKNFEGKVAKFPSDKGYNSEDSEDEAAARRTSSRELFASR